MNRKQFMLVLAALAIVGGAGLVLLRHHQESWTAPAAKTGARLLPNFRFNDVAAIHVRGGSDFNVVRSNGVWCVPERNNYPANLHQIRNLLISIRDLKIVQSEPIGRSQLERVELNPPGKEPGCGTLLEFKDAQGKTLDTLLVGKKHDRHQGESVPFGLHGLFDGRYVLFPGTPGNVLLISDELAGVAPELEAWLSRDFFKIENVKFIALLSTNAANSWKLSRETESSPWTLADCKPGDVLDTTIASQTAEILEFPTFVDVVSRSQNGSSAHVDSAPGVKEVGADAVASWPMVVTVRTFDRFDYTLNIGARGSRGTYLMTVAVVADIPLERSAEELPAEKTSVEFRDKTKQLREKLAREQALAPWVFEVEPSRIEPLVRDRAQFLQKPALVSEQALGNFSNAAERAR